MRFSVHSRFSSGDKLYTTSLQEVTVKKVVMHLEGRVLRFRYLVEFDNHTRVWFDENKLSSDKDGGWYLC